MLTRNITEIGVTFYKSGGHKHDGITSSLIDTTKYSIFDFDLAVSTGGTDVNRESRRQNNRARFDQYITKFVSSQVLEPAGIVLPANSVRGVDIGANEISANNIRANTITANEIAANTITAGLLVTDFAVVNSTIRSNNFTYDSNTGVGTGWAIYGNGTSVFVDGVFSGKIDVGGFDNTSFHVDTGGNVWAGSASFVTAPFRVASTGNTVIANGALTANTNGNVNITGNLTVSSNLIKFFPGTTASTALFVGGWINCNSTIQGQNIYSLGQLSGQSDFLISNGAGTEYLRLEGAGVAGLPGVTKLRLRRHSIGTDYAPSHYENQMLQLWNSSENFVGSQGVAGIAFAVGFSTVIGTVIRAFPSAGAAPSQAALSLNANGTVNVGTAGTGEGVDVTNYAGNGYSYIGASAFVYRSSQHIKSNIEYMPNSSRQISVERIKLLKPVRWDDKDGFSAGYLDKKFIDINDRWVAKGKSQLTPQNHHYNFRLHNCEIDDCIGDKDNKCPGVRSHEGRYGFVAEDVAEVFPKAAYFDGLGNPVGIDYAVISYALVETSQHLLDKIEELENKIAELSASK